MTGDVEEAVLEKYLSGISVKKIDGVTDALSKVRIGKARSTRTGLRVRTVQRTRRTNNPWDEGPIPGGTIGRYYQSLMYIGYAPPMLYIRILPHRAGAVRYFRECP
jgi:hypothetical protein